MRDPENIYTPPEGPQPSPPLGREIYLAMGEAKLFAMTQAFYEKLEVSAIRGLFPENMAEASKNLGMFLIFATGGPPLYQQRRGAPRMRARHLPFVIGPKEREVWLRCFREVLEEAPARFLFPEAKREDFWKYLETFSAWMVNAKA